MVRLGLTVALVLLGLDQLTKWVVLDVPRSAGATDCGDTFF